VFMSCPNHINTYHIHSQIFGHFHTSVVTVVVKCIYGVTLAVIGHRIVTWRKIYYLCVMGDLCY